MPDGRLVEVEELRRSYGGVPALHGLSFELASGEVLGLLGPNGAGKTTTLNILAGVLAPGAGRVRIGGVDLLAHPKAAKSRLGYLPEHPPLYLELTVTEYLEHCARLRGVPRRAVRAAAERVMARCGLEGTGRRLIANLSKGYRQRVGIAQALIHDPRLVILDEPTVGLDPNQVRDIRALVRELGGEHGVILSTHTLAEVQAVCDRVQIIAHGRLVLDERLERLGARVARAFTVRLRRPPPLERLERIPGVERVEPLEDGRLRVHHRAATPGDGEEIGERLLEAAVREGWGMAELTPERLTLEDLFVELTARDPMPDGRDVCGRDARSERRA